MSKTMTITMHGPAMGKPRMTQRDKWDKRDCVVRFWAWANHLKLLVKTAGGVPATERILDVSWVAKFEPPRSTSKKRREAMIGELHRVKPDRDNIDKAVLDALFDKDQGIASGTIRKEWAEESALVITITFR